MAENPGITKERILYEGQYLVLKEKTIGPVRWEYVARKKEVKAICIFPITKEREVILIRQYRIPLHQEIIELPAGLTDKAGEDEIQTAIRELQEETGYHTEKIGFLLNTYSSAGMSSEAVSIYYAIVGGKTQQNLDPAESIFVYPPIPLSELIPFLQKEEAKGYAIDYKILSAYALFNSRSIALLESAESTAKPDSTKKT